MKYVKERVMLFGYYIFEFSKSTPLFFCSKSEIFQVFHIPSNLKSRLSSISNFNKSEGIALFFHSECLYQDL